jgi:circadian clock protein KaiC
VTAARKPARLLSGAPNVDLVLGGGLLGNAINLLIGPPGAGKTILAQQYLFNNATKERPGIYLATVSEPLEKMLHYGQTLSFFDKEAVGSSVFYEDLSATMNERGLPGVLAQVDRLLKERRPGVVVIDSFKALHPYAESQGDFRRFLHGLAARLSVLPVTSFWVGEYGRDDATSAPEFAVADAIVSLHTERAADRERRVLQVLKLRGSGFMSGQHAYRLSGEGFEVFPRLADPADVSSYGTERHRISSGIPILDEMLVDGYWRGASTLVVGPSGAGKTLMGLHFVFAGARLGEPSLIATFQENPVQLEYICQGFGWSLRQDNVEVVYRTPVDVYIDEWVYELLGFVERSGAKRLMIDSLGDLRAAAGDEIRFREYVYSLLQRLSRASVSVLMTQEVPQLFGVTHLSQYGISHLSDNVVLLQYLAGQSRVKRAASVLKTRASGHDPHIREYDITKDGFVVGKPFSDSQGLR